MTVNDFMAAFLVAGADYDRLNEAVHEYLDNIDSLDAATKNECISRISDCIASSKESIDRAKGAARGALATDIPNDQVYEDVVASFGMVRRWDNSISMLISIMRTIALETDIDCIDLLARSRSGDHATVRRTERTLDIADPDGIELFSEYPDDEDDSEDESEEEDYNDEDATDEESEGEIVDGIEEDDAEPEPHVEVVDGCMPSDIPTNSTAVREVEPADDDGAEIFIAQTAEGMVEDVPVEKPLTREEIQSIVLETMKEFFAQTAPIAAQEEEKPKKTTRRRSTAAKPSRRGLRRKKTEETEDESPEAPEVEE